jgi:hypothetical protein
VWWLYVAGTFTWQSQETLEKDERERERYAKAGPGMMPDLRWWL